MEKLDKEAIRLLDRLYKDLYLSDEVLHHGNGNQYDKFNNIKTYLDKLEKIHDIISDTGEHIDLLKKLYYEKYIIKREYVPESYYEHQQEIALERGLGHVEITENQKKEMQEEVINNQKASLDIWIEYLLSEDAKVYPFWAKYWAFQGMLKLGNYDKEIGEFGRRTKDTVAPFADLNREALAMSIDLVIKLMNKEEINDKELETLVKTGSFQKIYSYIATKLLKENKNIAKRNIGRWVKYNQGSDHMHLVNSLQGYNTGWCTAGEATAKSQLSMGDFYVYYTLDENNEYKVPRIAIRMEYGKIAEIRGIAENQNLEPEMEDAVEEKIKDFPDKEEYYKKVNDMKKLTSIYKKQQNHEVLIKEELSFLYELDDEIIGFGYGRDPRIEEIISQRNVKDDLSSVFDCEKNQIAKCENEITNDTVYYYGDLYLRSLRNTENLVLPQIVGGYLYLDGLRSAEGLVLPQSVNGGLNLENLTSAEGLVLPQSVGGELNLKSLRNAEGLVLPKSIKGRLDLRNLTNMEGLVLPQSIGGELNLRSLRNAEGLVLPQSVNGFLNLGSLTSAKGLVLPQSINGFLDLGSLTNAEGLVLPQSVNGFLDLGSLTSAKGLVLPQSVGGELNLKSLTNAEELVLPQSVNGGLNLRSLTSAEGLVLPQSVNGFLDLGSLTNAKGLVLPQSVDGVLNLINLTSAEGLVLPQSVGGSVNGYIDLRNLANVEGLVLPETLTYKIVMNGFEITPQNVDNYRNSKKEKRKNYKLFHIKNILNIINLKNNNDKKTNKSKK